MLKKHIVHSTSLNHLSEFKHALKEIDVINETHNKLISALSKNSKIMKYDKISKLRTSTQKSKQI